MALTIAIVVLIIFKFPLLHGEAIEPPLEQYKFTDCLARPFPELIREPVLFCG